MDMSTLTLPDTQLSKIVKFFKTCSDIYTGKEATLKRFVQAVLWIIRMGAASVIPPRANHRHSSVYDVHLYKERHLVECFMNKIKHYRRIFSRFDKLATRYLGFLSFVAAIIWLR